MEGELLTPQHLEQLLRFVATAVAIDTNQMSIEIQKRNGDLMADRRVTVVNPAGYQEQLPDTDNLLLTAEPSADTHAVNKLYVDTTGGCLPTLT